MPGSNLEGKYLVKEWLEKHKDINTIVDLGPGAATYPKLMDFDCPVRANYIWKAVEIWGPYIEKFNLNNYYSEIRLGDIQYMELPKGDCCIAGDVLEHLSREMFIKTFKKIDAQFKHVVISVPVNLLSNDIFEGNFNESHISYWSQKELDDVFVGYERKHSGYDADPCLYYFKGDII